MAKSTKNRPLTKTEEDQAILDGIQIRFLVEALPLKSEVKINFLAALQHCNYEQLQGVRQFLQKIARKAIDTVIKTDVADKFDGLFDKAKKDVQDLTAKYNAKLDKLAL